MNKAQEKIPPIPPELAAEVEKLGQEAMIALDKAVKEKLGERMGGVVVVVAYPDGKEELDQGSTAIDVHSNLHPITRVQIFLEIARSEAMA